MISLVSFYLRRGSVKEIFVAHPTSFPVDVLGDGDGLSRRDARSRGLSWREWDGMRRGWDDM